MDCIEAVGQQWFGQIGQHCLQNAGAVVHCVHAVVEVQCVVVIQPTSQLILSRHRARPAKYTLLDDICAEATLIGEWIGILGEMTKNKNELLWSNRRNEIICWICAKLTAVKKCDTLNGGFVVDFTEVDCRCFDFFGNANNLFVFASFTLWTISLCVCDTRRNSWMDWCKLHSRSMKTYSTASVFKSNSNDKCMRTSVWNCSKFSHRIRLAISWSVSIAYVVVAFNRKLRFNSNLTQLSAHSTSPPQFHAHTWTTTDYISALSCIVYAVRISRMQHKNSKWLNYWNVSIEDYWCKIVEMKKRNKMKTKTTKMQQTNLQFHFTCVRKTMSVCFTSTFFRCRRTIQNNWDNGRNRFDISYAARSPARVCVCSTSATVSIAPLSFKCSPWSWRRVDIAWPQVMRWIYFIIEFG